MDVNEFEARAEAVRKAKKRYQTAVAARDGAQREVEEAREAEHFAYREFTKFVRDAADFPKDEIYC